MAQTKLNTPQSSAEKPSEATKMDARGEIMLLTLESKLAILEQARDKYHPRYWYCADLITRAVNQGKAEAAQKMFACFDKWIASPKDTAVRNRLFDMLEVDAATSTSPDQRAFNERLFRTAEPVELAAVLENILNLSA